MRTRHEAAIRTIAGSALGAQRPPMDQARRPAFKPNKPLSAVQHFDQFRSVVAYVTRRHAKASFERTIEIGQITKARVICDCPDWTWRKPRLGQHVVGTTETLRQQEFRERRTLTFKKPLQIARREPEMSRYQADREVAPVAVLGDVRFCHTPTCGGDCASRPHAVTCGPKRECNEVVQMIDCSSPELRCRQCHVVEQRSCI